MQSLMREANGKKSNTTTILWLSWIISILLTVASMIDVDKAVWGISIRPVDPSIILFLLGPAMGLYGYRRKCEHEELKETMDRLEK